MAMDPNENGSRTSHVDLTTCENEQIHLLGRVQPFGFLLGADPSWSITHASENLERFIGISTADCLGKPLADVIGTQALHTVRNKLQFLRGKEGTEHVRNLAIDGSLSRFDVSMHVSGGTFVLEFEPALTSDSGEDEVAQVRTFVGRLASAPNLERFCSSSARFIQLMTGFDRIMVYRFRPDDSGEVIAEIVSRDMEPYLGLRYPASDIPPQARRLYLKNTIRIISDVDDVGSAITSVSSADLPTLDLTQSALRAVSPIHIEYLRNMGVAASMSISVIVAGRLWGLFACHHSKPMILNQPTRNAVDLFGQMFSLLLTSRLQADEAALDNRVSGITNSFSRQVDTSDEPLQTMVPVLKEFQELLEADGFGLNIDGQTVVEGVHLSDDGFESICEFLNTKSTSIFASDALQEVISSGKVFLPDIAGMLALSISRSPRDYIIFFRNELPQTVRWAGDPKKPVTVGPLGERLTPRKSFEIWRETVTGHSAPWTPANLRAATALRLTLLEVVLRFTDVAARERQIAQERQEILIAELNHRVRNILGLVKGIVSQSQSDSMTTAEYVGMLDNRIQSLARAHDQITKDNWAPASFKSLLRIEAGGYLLDKGERIETVGDDFLLQPNAFSTVALVVHELMTNAAKYGALMDKRGKVLIELSLSPNGNAQIHWKEKGGPRISEPTKRGFGSTIIRRSIPFELGGTADVEFEEDGLRARFEIPSTFVSGRPAFQDDQPPKPDIQATDQNAVPGNVLVVEDNLLIAMEAEELFRAIGSLHVEIAPNLSSARELVRQVRPDFVLLDVNLGNETSYSLAEELVADRIPVGFATGYGDSATFPETLRNVPRISKPYERDSILKLLKSAGL